MRKPEIESIVLTEDEMSAAIYEGKVKKHFHQKAIGNGVKWDTEHPDFGQTVKEKKYRRPRQNDFKKPDGFDKFLDHMKTVHEANGFRKIDTL